MKAPDLKQVGRYEILSAVGRGAMGAVYRAQDPTIRRIVALKVIPAGPSSQSQPGSLSGANFFEREAQAAGSLLHPSIVTLYDAGLDGAWYYLAMEFLEGENFAAEIAREQRIGVERAGEVGAVVAEALDFAHERGVVHRDIKPANLMVLPDRTVKVADFGIARLTSAASTMTGDMMVGTPHYMSPEQVRGGKIDGRSDLFSLGVVLYEALTGRKPFPAPSLAAVLNQILTATPPAPRDVDPAIPKELSDIVMRSIERDPDRRYPRGKELARDLRSFVAVHTGAAVPVRRPPRGVRRIAVAATGVATAVVVLAGAYGLGLLREEPPPAPTARGFIKFASEPTGAEIVLDGRVIGTTPYNAEVPEGLHEIEFRKDGYYPTAATVNVPANERVPVEVEMEARRE